MKNFSSINHSFGGRDRTEHTTSPASSIQPHASRDVTAKSRPDTSSPYLVPKRPAKLPPDPLRSSRAFGLMPRSRFADGLFLALALAGALAMWWSVW